MNAARRGFSWRSGAVGFIIGVAACVVVYNLLLAPDGDAAPAPPAAATVPGDSAPATAAPSSGSPVPTDGYAVEPRPWSDEAGMAQREAHEARARARALFGDERRPEDNPNFALGLEYYRQAEAHLEADEHRLAALHFRDAAEFFEGAVPAPPRAPVITPMEPSPAPRPAPAPPSEGPGDDGWIDRITIVPPAAAPPAESPSGRVRDGASAPSGD